MASLSTAKFATLIFLTTRMARTLKHNIRNTAMSASHKITPATNSLGTPVTQTCHVHALTYAWQVGKKSDCKEAGTNHHCRTRMLLERTTGGSSMTNFYSHTHFWFADKRKGEQGFTMSATCGEYFGTLEVEKVCHV